MFASSISFSRLNCDLVNTYTDQSTGLKIVQNVCFLFFSFRSNRIFEVFILNLYFNLLFDTIQLL